MVALHYYLALFLFLVVPCAALQCVIVTFLGHPGRTHCLIE